MEKTDLLSRITTLNPSNYQISQALVFLRIVVDNNPNKLAADIKKRSDVQQAVKVVTDWVDDVNKVMEDSFQILPKLAGRALVDSMHKTLDGFKDEVNLTESRVTTWRQDNNREISIAKIILRMTWTVDWIAAQVNGLTMDAPFKQWVCRMAPNSCSFCKALNGVTIPKAASFAKYARKAGFKRVYGGLYAPKLHPNCMCTVIPITREQYDTYKKGRVVS